MVALEHFRGRMPSATHINTRQPQEVAWVSDGFSEVSPAAPQLPQGQLRDWPWLANAWDVAQQRTASVSAR